MLLPKALGLNSGVQDADNLIWKLAFALKHPQHNCERLLSSYDSERRPIGERVGKTSLYNMRAHAMILDEAIGLSPSRSEAENVEAMVRYFDLKDRYSGLAKREEVGKALEHLDVEFYAHGAEVGWFYDFDYIGTYGANTKDRNPQVKQDGDMELCTYRETTRPGSQLAHLWLRYLDDDKRISSRELVSKDKLLLITISSRWKHLKQPLIDVKILNSNGDYLPDDEGRLKEIWQREGLSDTGALLVRPDNIVAYRFLDDTVLTALDYQSEMQQIVHTVLGFQ